MKKNVACLLVFLSLSVGAVDAWAHSPGQSYLFLRVYDDSILVRVEITARDLERALNVGLNLNKPISRADVDAHLGSILAYVNSHLHIGTGQTVLPLRYTGYDFRHVEIADYVLLHYVIDGPKPLPRQLDVEYSVLLDTDPKHRNMMVVEHDWKGGLFNNERVIAATFSPNGRRQPLDLSSSSVLRGFLGLVELGSWHIWIGLDHILFLLALVLPSVLYREKNEWKPVPSFRPALLNIAAIITLFTIAHAISLTLASLGLVRLQPSVVEPVVAGSIAVAALHNLYPRFIRWDRAIAFVFGLFHGFAFANILAEFGMERKYMVHSLLGFNLGVEFGQIVILAVVFPILYVFRKKRFYTEVVLTYGSILLIFIALLWFVERVFDISFYRYGRRVLRRAYRLIV